MADETKRPDDTKNKDKEEKRRQQTRKARKRLNIALWSALILSTAGNLVSGTLEFWKSKEEHRDFVQLVERCDKRVAEVNNRQARWKELNQAAEHLRTVKDAIQNLPNNPAAMDHYEHLITTIGQRAVTVGREAKLSEETSGADAYEKALRELEDLVAGWDQRQRNQQRAERLYEAANKIQSAIEKLMTFGAFSADTRGESDTVAA
jgi:hypothetical protein